MHSTTSQTISSLTNTNWTKVVQEYAGKNYTDGYKINDTAITRSTINNRLQKNPPDDYHETDHLDDTTTMVYFELSRFVHRGSEMPT